MSAIRISIIGLALVAGGTAPTPPARADEPVFAYVYTTDLLPKDKYDVEQRLTDRDGQAYGYHNSVNHLTEGIGTLAALRQLSAIGFTDDQKAQMLHGRLYGDEHTTWDGIRLIVGRSF